MNYDDALIEQVAEMVCDLNHETIETYEEMGLS